MKVRWVKNWEKILKSHFSIKISNLRTIGITVENGRVLHHSILWFLCTSQFSHSLWVFKKIPTHFLVHKFIMKINNKSQINLTKQIEQNSGQKKNFNIFWQQNMLLAKTNKIPKSIYHKTYIHIITRHIFK